MSNNTLITCNANLVSVDITHLEEPFTLEFTTGDGIIAEIKAGHDGERLILEIKDGTRPYRGLGTQLSFSIAEEKVA